MRIKVLSSTEAAATEAAQVIAAQARVAVAARGCFLLAVSGGKTPWQMLRTLATENLPWANVHFFQVDERVAPRGHEERNLTHLRESLLPRAPLPSENLHPMPVEVPELEFGAQDYARTLQQFAGNPPALDLVHLGLGTDGHTASLVPGDPVLEVQHQDVALTGVYQGRRRMTLSYPLLNRARQILWLVTGAEKAEMLERLRKGDPSIPAGRVRQDHALVLTERAAVEDRA